MHLHVSDMREDSMHFLVPDKNKQLKVKSEQLEVKNEQLEFKNEHLEIKNEQLGSTHYMHFHVHMGAENSSESCVASQ